MKGYKEIDLVEILSSDELEDVRMLITNNDWIGLRTYLNKIKDNLKKKGVLADYLYYFLESQFKK